MVVLNFQQTYQQQRKKFVFIRLCTLLGSEVVNLNKYWSYNTGFWFLQIKPHSTGKCGDTMIHQIYHLLGGGISPPKNQQ